MTARLYGEQDAALLRGWIEERNQIAAPVARYYSLVRGANVDPLYREPVADPLLGGPAYGAMSRHADAFEYVGPREMILAVVFERASNASSEANEAGIDTTCDGEACVARNEWERVWPGIAPKKGDVLWVSDEWWDVVGANTGGHVMDSGHYVDIKLSLRKRDRFTPDRKVS